MKILGIQRAVKFSPNHTGNDSAIFIQTQQELEKRGVAVRTCTEEEFHHSDTIKEQFIFSMVRNLPSVRKLEQLQREGKTVVNSAFGIENCLRSNMVRLLKDEVPQPKTYILSTSDNPDKIFEKMGSGKCWIKRGDFHAIHREDVTFCRNAEEGRSILKEFALRGISTAVVCEHLKGDLVKFYGVRGSDFFYWFHPYDNGHVKFEYEGDKEVNNYSFDADVLMSVAAKAAEILDIHIYGGDAIVSENGDIHIIDINDWPSFAPCRDVAAGYIAECIIDNMHHVNEV